MLSRFLCTQRLKMVEGILSSQQTRLTHLCLFPLHGSRDRLLFKLL
ncbi:unnamed protein product, partial [Allacma fusca]